MSLQCLNSTPLLADLLVRTGAFAGNPLRVVDVGARDGFEAHWEAVFKDQVRLLGFEPDAEECARLNRSSDVGIRAVIPYALHADEGVRDFFVAAFPASSGFYRPDAAFWNRFADRVNLTLLRTERIETHDLSSVLRDEAVRAVDFIKLDTEGSELDILRGATDVLDRSVLGLSIECEFSQVRHDQPLFSDVDVFLRRHHFELMDLSTYKHSRLALPLSLEPHSSGRGQLLWGQALYLRDAVRELNDPDRRGHWDAVRVLKMASLFDLFSLQDCAAELIQAATVHGLCSEVMATEYLNCAASSISGRGVTYDQYFALLVLRGLPRFLQSAPGAVAGATAAHDISEHLRAGRVAIAMREIIDRFGVLLDHQADDVEGLWRQIYLEHLVQYERPIRDLYDRLESHQLPSDALDELRSVDYALHASLPLESVAHSSAAIAASDAFVLLRANIVAHLANRPLRRIVCYGAGDDFTMLVRSDVFRDHAVVAVVDNYRSPGARVEGVPIVDSGDLRKIEHDMVIVTSARWAGELRTAALRWTVEHAPSIPVI